jgi:hypothetical protein
MVTRKKKLPKRTPAELDKFNSDHYAGTFDLGFLQPQEPPISYQNELLTAEEKAAYYEDLIQNNGFENSKNIANDCMKKADALKKKVKGLEEDEAWPLLEKIVGLVSLANYHGDLAPPDVLESQRNVDDAVPCPWPPELKKSLAELGLPDFKLAQNSDDATGAGADGGDSKKLVELRRKARFWKNIHSWGQVERMAYYFCGPVKPPDWIEAVFVRAQKDQYASKILSWEARHSISRLLYLAEMGNEAAAKEAVDMLDRFVRLLNLYAKINPEVFRKVASRLISWPLVFSPHPKLNQIPQTIAKQIGLGTGIDYVFDAATEWNPSEQVCKIAMHLYEHIKMMRQYPESNELLPFFDEAIKLPNIKQPGSVKAWWKVAEKILNKSFPKPEEDDVLRRLTKIKDRAKANSKIREIIKNRFFSLFPPKFR